MSLKNKLFTIIIVFFLPIAAQADSILSELPKAKKDYSDSSQCVESIDDMRKHHMTYIMHQRDDTLRSGIRTSKHSLKECINCHITPDKKDGKVARYGEKEHFCSSCHIYTAVKIDCFTCHADKPENTEYRHKLSSAVMQHHTFAATELDQDMLKLLATQKEGQQ